MEFNFYIRFTFNWLSCKKTIGLCVSDVFFGLIK